MRWQNFFLTTMSDTALPFDELQWEILLTELHAKRVVPIIGPELLRVKDPESGEDVRLDEWLALRLAEKLGVTNDPDVLQRRSLSSVFLAYAGARRRINDAYTALFNLVKQLPFAPPESLRKLARIEGLDLFVTTTFDGLLARAIDEERYRGGSVTESVSFNAQGVVDLDHTKNELQRPVVFHILGKAGAGPCYAITDEDILEWITKLQSNNYSPPNLGFELKHNHLLFLGLGYEDWLTRFFMRTIKGGRLSDPRDKGEIIADSRMSKDGNLCAFLTTVSDNTRLYEGGASAFVDELAERWTASGMGGSTSLGAATQEPAEVGRFLPPEREMPARAVFISYAHEDVECVKRLKAGLDAAGIVSWFDLNRLESGDNYREKIEKNIRRCDFFIPIISKTTVNRDEGFFHREWKWAKDRREAMSPTAVFILPVVIDDTNKGHPRLGEYFPALTAAVMHGGAPDAAFIERLLQFFQPPT